MGSRNHGPSLRTAHYRPVTAPCSEAGLALELLSRAAARESVLSGKVLGLVGYGTLGRHG